MSAPRIVFTTSDDGTRLRLGRWGESSREVLIVHGLAEHLGRYQHVAERLCAAGWAVSALELRGHGESGGRRGHTPVWHRYVEDVQAALALIGRPVVLLAHSMGGLVALDALREPLAPAVRAVALSNPLIDTPVEVPPLKAKAARLLDRLVPWFPINNELDTELICRDSAVVRAYEADPLVFPSVTPRWFAEMNLARARIQEDPPQRDIPLRMMVGTGDRICDHEASRAYVRRWQGPTETVVYEGFYHELFNEPEKARVLDELVAWLDTLGSPDA